MHPNHLKQLNEYHCRHYVLGGATAAISCVFIFHIIAGVMMLHHPSAFLPPAQAGKTAPNPLGYPFAPPSMGYLFLVMGCIAVLGGWTLGGLTAYAGRCLKARKRYIFVLVIAGVNCAFVMPLGTLLGAFTILVLQRPAVRALFGKQHGEESTEYA